MDLYLEKYLKIKKINYGGSYEFKNRNNLTSNFLANQNSALERMEDKRRQEAINRQKFKEKWKIKET